MENEIELLKININIALNILESYQDLSDIVNELRKKIDSFDVEKYGILAYKGYLDDILNFNIKELNKLVKDKQDNLFDDRTDKLLEEITKIEHEIEEVIAYLNNIFPNVADLLDKLYKRYKKDYQSELNIAYDYNKLSYASYIGTNDNIYLTVYGGTQSLSKCYLRLLETFKTTTLIGLKKIAETDQIIKEKIDKYKNISANGTVYNEVVKIEEEYLLELDNNRYVSFIYNYSDIATFQKEILKRINDLDKTIEEIETENSYREYLYSLNFNNIDIDKILEILIYVEENNKLENEFYSVLFALVEREKYLKKKYEIKYNLIDKLPKEVILKLEVIFAQRLSLLDKYKMATSFNEYREKGYLNVLDKSLEVFFERNVEIKTVLKNIGKIETSESYKKLSNDELRDFTKTIIERNKFNIILKKYLSINDYKLAIQIDENLFKIVYEKDSSILNKISYFYFDKEGKRINNIPSNMNIHASHGNVYITDNGIVDKDTLKTIYSYDCKSKFAKYEVNNDKKLITINTWTDNHSDEYLMLFDFDGNLIYKCSLNDVLSVINESFAKDYKHEPYKKGTFLISRYNGDYIYFSIEDENQEHFFNFLFNPISMSYIAFDGIYDEDEKEARLYSINNYNRVRLSIDNNYRFGYMDRNEKKIIDPKYCYCSPFCAGIAYVEMYDWESDSRIWKLIDIYGNNIVPNFEINGNISYDLDLKNDCFIIKRKSSSFDVNLKEYVRAKTSIIINNDKTILSLFMPQEEKENKENNKMLVK